MSEEANETNEIKENKLRLNIKKNTKGKFYEYTVRADDIKELTKLQADVEALAEKVCEE